MNEGYSLINEEKHLRDTFFNLNEINKKFLFNKDNPLDLIRSLISFQSQKEKALYQQGNLQYAYIFKRRDLSMSKGYFMIYFLHSPSSLFEQQPTMFQEIAAKMVFLSDIKTKTDKNLRDLINFLTNNSGAAYYFPIDSRINEQQVYLSKIFVREDHFVNLKMGLNLFLFDMKKKFAILVPRLLLSENYLKEYDKQ